MEPDRFERAMPKAVKQLLADARKRKGPAAEWFAERNRSQRAATFVILRRAAIPPEAMGWLAGIAMFDDELGSIADVVATERIHAAVPAMIDAFVAGVHAGVPLVRKHWKRIEVLAGILAEIPDGLRDVLPLALVSDGAVDRGVGLRLARRCDDRNAIERARDAATGKPRKRLDDALVTLGGGAANDHEPLRASSKTELEVLWLARAASRKPDDLDMLLGTPWPGAWKAALARIKALAKFPPDARIAAILPQIRAQHVSYGSRPLRSAIASLAGDLEITAPAPAKISHANVDEMWRDVRAHPEDLGARAVLADALQAAGDPRGEYIAIALAIAAGTADAAAKRRASQLLAAHIDTWSAGIPGALRASRRFERGFLATVHCKTKHGALLASVDEPAWWSVEELHLSSHNDFRSPRDAVEKLLETAPALRSIISHWWSDEVLLQLRGTYPRVRVIGTRSLFDPAKVQSFPALAMVGLSGRADVHLAEIKDVPTLLVFDHRALGKPLAEFAKQPAVAELRIAAGRELDMDHRGWLVRVRRDDTRATLSWGVGKYEPGSLTTYVAALVASGRREIAIAPPSIGRDAVEQEAKRIKTAKLDWLAAPLATWRV